MHSVKTVLLALATVLLGLQTVAAGGGHADEEAESGLHSPDLAPGQSWSHTFAEEGRFDYHCHPHPWMLAGINVVPSSGRAARTYTIEIMEPKGQDFENWTFSPSLTTIEVGDTVTWINTGAVTHVVQETVGEHIEHVGTLAGPGGDEHGATPAGDSHGASLGFPTQGWLWVAVALVGGLLIGRRTTRMLRKTSPPQATAPQPSAPSDMAAAKDKET